MYFRTQELHSKVSHEVLYKKHMAKVQVYNPSHLASAKNSRFKFSAKLYNGVILTFLFLNLQSFSRKSRELRAFSFLTGKKIKPDAEAPASQKPFKGLWDRLGL